MPLQITGRHMSISDEQRDYIDKKVNRLRRLCPKIDEMNFVLTKEKLNFQVDATFRAGKVFAQATTTNAQALAAIDILVDKIEAQVSKTKEKWDTRKKDSAREKALAHAEQLAPEAIEEEEEEEELEAVDPDGTQA